MPSTQPNTPIRAEANQMNKPTTIKNPIKFI